MSGNSVQDAGSAFQNYTGVGQVMKAVGLNINPPKAPDLQAPNANSSTPTVQQANTTAIQNQLSKEHMASTGSILTGGQGLLDEPTTTGRVLVGT